MLKATNLKNTKIKKIVRYDLSFLFLYFFILPYGNIGVFLTAFLQNSHSLYN